MIDYRTRDIATSSHDPIFVRSVFQLMLDDMLREIETSSIEIIYTLKTTNTFLFEVIEKIIREKFASNTIQCLDSELGTLITVALACTFDGRSRHHFIHLMLNRRDCACPESEP